MAFKRASFLIPILTLPLLVGCHSSYTPSHWLEQVPATDRAKHAPFPSSTANVQAGRDDYAQYCAKCHADDALGTQGRPGLRTVRVHDESDGEVYWILHNGSTDHGMPAWRGLGDTAIWQIVQYIRSLPPEPASSHERIPTKRETDEPIH